MKFQIAGPGACPTHKEMNMTLHDDEYTYATLSDDEIDRRFAAAVDEVLEENRRLGVDADSLLAYREAVREAAKRRPNLFRRYAAAGRS